MKLLNKRSNCRRSQCDPIRYPLHPMQVVHQHQTIPRLPSRMLQFRRNDVHTF